MKVIDLTHTITNNTPVYPGTKPPTLEPISSYEKDGYKETLITMFSHTGTHMDPPAHLYADRTTLDQFPAEQFIGKALVIDCRMLKEGEAITMEQLKPYGDLVEKAEFLLFNLGWDKRWGTDDYFGDYPCVDDEVLDALMDGSTRHATYCRHILKWDTRIGRNNVHNLLVKLINLFHLFFRFYGYTVL